MILETIMEIAAGIVSASEKNVVCPEANLVTDLRFDSIKILRLYIEMEKRLGVSFDDLGDDIDFAEFDTIEKLSKLVLMLKNK
jgi:acyl carrier protein